MVEKIVHHSWKAEPAPANNVFIYVAGTFLLELPPDNYIVVAAYHDGTDRIVSEFAVDRGASYEIDFTY